MGALFFFLAFLCALLALIGILVPADLRGVLIVLMFIALGLLVGGTINWPTIVRKA